MWSRLAVVVVATLAGLVVSAGLAAPASAHAVLERSSPADGSRVDGPLAAVSLTFDEAVQPVPAFDEVIATSGARVDTGAPRLSADGATLVLPLRPDLPRGSYTAVWRVVSADTHVVSGSITFGLGVDPADVPPRPTEATGPLDVAADVAKGLVYAGLVLLLGVAAAAALWWPWALETRRVRLAARAGWLLAAAGTAGALLLQGPRAAEAGWAGVVGLVGLDRTLAEPFGAALAVRLALLVAVAPLLTRRSLGGLRRRAGRAVGAVAGVALLATVAAAGHEAVGADVPFALAAAMVHLVAVTVWLGGLAALAGVVLPAARAGVSPGPTAAGLRRWSITAYTCVAGLVLSGEYQAARQLAPVQALWSTSYGIVLLVKLGLVAVIVAVAAVAQRRVAALPADPDRAASADVVAAVRRSVRVECAVAVAVLAVTAVLVSQPPGNTTYGPPVTVVAPLGPDTVRIHVDTTLRGRQELALDVVDGAGRPVPVRSLDATLSSATVAALALKVRPATAGGPSAGWRSAPVVVPGPGVWTVHLDVSVDQADAYATVARYRVW